MGGDDRVPGGTRHSKLTSDAANGARDAVNGLRDAHRFGRRMTATDSEDALDDLSSPCGLGMLQV